MKLKIGNSLFMTIPFSNTKTCWSNQNFTNSPIRTRQEQELLQ